MSLTGNGTAICYCSWSSEPREGPAVCSAKAVPSFLSYFKTLSIGPAPGIEPATSRSAIKRSIDCASLVAVTRGGGGTPRKFGWGCAAPPLETRTLFQSKICDIPYPISALTQNSIPYFTPDLTLFRSA